ncbi:transposase [Sedimentitalea sp. HM32M-2]|uniref:transposase n=1 Tax=Sedimentitalea sp. HM32M-2 TaxID=3351566 RepID=UPI00362CFD70
MLQGDVRLRARDICGQVCCEKGDNIIRDVLSADHVHMFVPVPPGLAVSDLVRLMKGRSSHKVQRECAQLRQRYGADVIGAGGSSRRPTARLPKTSCFIPGKTHRRSCRRQPVVVQPAGGSRLAH